MTIFKFVVTNGMLDGKLTIFNVLFHIKEYTECENTLYALKFIVYICHIKIFA